MNENAATGSDAPAADRPDFAPAVSGAAGQPAAAAQRAERVLERMGDAHVAFDREFRYVAVNAAGERSMGRLREALLGRTLLEAFPDAAGSESERQYRRVLSEGVEVHFAEHYQGDGLDTHIEVDAYPTEDGGVAVFWREVTARVRAEQALRRSEARYRALAHAVGQIVWTTAPDGQVEDVPEWRAYTGQTPAECRGWGWLDALHSDDRERAARVWQAAVDARGLYDIEYRVRGRDGRYRWFHARGVPVLGDAPGAHDDGDDAGSPALPPIREWVGCCTDVDDRKRSDADLELTNHQLQEQAAELEATTEALQASAADLEEQVEAAERAAAALRHSEARLRALAETVPDVVWTARPDGFLDWYNRRWTEYTGMSIEETQGWGWGPVLHPDDLQQCIDVWSCSVATGQPYEVEYRWRRASDGEYRWHLGRALPVMDAAGRVVQWFGSGTDIHEQKVAREQADAARAEADAARAAAVAANRAKGEFLAVMSHELRTPLNAIGGYAELLAMGLRGPVTDQQRADITRIQASQRHLLGLVNEVLDLATVDAGELRVERAAVRAGDTVDAALALVRPQATAKALALSEACGGAAERPYLGDEPRVRQVLVNLLANAVKFTGPGGRVAVTCAVTDAPPAGATLGADTPYVALRVEDTGVGIAPDQLSRIFEPFTQVEGGLTRPRGGTGLGLAISRRLARLMGGDLTVESRPGSGSAFTLWLPTPERRAQARAHQPAAGAPRTGAERPTPPSLQAIDAPDLARIGAALVAEVDPVLRAWVARLRADPGIPEAPARSDAELEDHAATFVTDVALVLRTMGEPGGEPAALLRDGTAILALIAERHGAQRARLGWPEDAIAREFALLGEVLDGAVHRVAAGAGDLTGSATLRASALVAHLLEQGTRLSVGGYRLASGTPAV